MKSKNTFVAIILARGGSKGIKNKNLVKLKKKPLLYWSIKACLKAKKINSVWVSSDSNKILNFAKRVGANIIKRPKQFASDHASSESAWLHGVKYLNKNNIKNNTIVGIQPTSPIRFNKDLDNAILKFKREKLDSLFSAQIINDYFVWKKKGNKLVPNYNYKKRQRRQNIQDKYLENGSFFLFNSKKFLKMKCRLFGKIGLFKMKKTSSFQIDDHEDLKIIKSLEKYLV